MSFRFGETALFVGQSIDRCGWPDCDASSGDIGTNATWACPSGSSAFALLLLHVVQKRWNHPGTRGGVGASYGVAAIVPDAIGLPPVALVGTLNSWTLIVD